LPRLVAGIMGVVATTAVANAGEPQRALVCLIDLEPYSSSDNRAGRENLRNLLKPAGARSLLNETAAATGFSRKQVVVLAEGSWHEAVASADVLIGDHGSLRPPFRAASSWAVMALVGPLSATRTWSFMIDPLTALLQLLERLVRLGRRADAARQLAVQRQQLARHAVAAAPDRPPGEVVVSSARVPRGPDFSRVAPTRLVEATRGRLLVAA